MKTLLKTKAETLAWVASHDESTPGKYDVVSDWIADELDRFEADSGFVYNRPAAERLVSENGLDPSKTVLLGSLVYNAQDYRSRRRLVRDGWLEVTGHDVLAPFVTQTVRVLSFGGMMGAVEGKVRRLGGVLRLCPPRSRNRYLTGDLWILPKGGAS
ncbi:MAG: hypothetical protein WC655_05745 [Candidatus Hydrogenedentales bacterium]|jgi:hypothetical protein